MSLELFSDTFEVNTPGRGTFELTDQVRALIRRVGLAQGLAHLFVHHTSASLIICENADPTVRRDLETFAASLAPDGDPRWLHCDEGPDDMAAHLRAIFTGFGLWVPIRRGDCDLGTWQGIYLWEHRARPHRRRVTLTMLGTRERSDT
ncbi:protein of unknown function UPF0047 [Isosphaera pallida ATCC 43644]|uniref:Secondary thiamine-phosphate synthase enzyme n=1 Tax=Isosphaera pallida (strain ATCC 43644 / DSM 9630 / IS1B) TaxID=575540 RepID=E8R0C4_ISOPI|nr:secondary thiamine-phosphate synthase enzyme YjbQ [Isosphaera pallida]ADV62251.1 protein of unknown function UPF0047 [Isosphaera pallida ATCC 43644]